jgi:hypothetical protein
VTISWIHPLSRVIGALLDAGLTLDRLTEHPFTVFERWPFLTRDDQGRYWLSSEIPALPLLYSLRATRTR